MWQTGSSGARPVGGSCGGPGGEGEHPASESKPAALPDWLQLTPVGRLVGSTCCSPPTDEHIPACLLRSPAPPSGTANLHSWSQLNGQDVLLNVIANPQWANYFMEVARHAASPSDPVALLRAVTNGGAPLYALAQVPLSSPRTDANLHGCGNHAKLPLLQAYSMSLSWCLCRGHARRWPSGRSTGGQHFFFGVGVARKQMCSA